jgi:hypothetical protein
MEYLGKPISFPALHRVFVQSFPQNIAVLFMPWSVMDFSNDRFHSPRGGVITIIEAHGIETVAKIPQMGQEANGPIGADACPLLDKISHGSIQGELRVSQMVRSVKTGQVETF